MAVTFFVAGSVTGGKHLWKISDDGTTLAIVDSYALAGDVTALAVSSVTSRIFAAIGTSIYCYDTDGNLVTAWGSSGSVSIGAAIRQIVVDSSDYLAVAHATASSGGLSLYNATGTKVWTATQFQDDACYDVKFGTDGNIIASVTNNTTGNIVLQVDRTDGSTLITYKSGSNKATYGIAASPIDSDTIYTGGVTQSGGAQRVSAFDGSSTALWNYNTAQSGSAIEAVYRLPTLDIVVFGYSTILKTLDGTAGTLKKTASAVIGNIDRIICNSANEIYSITNSGYVYVHNYELTLSRFLNPSTATLTGIGILSDTTTPVDITDKTYSKKLIAIGYNELDYESAAGTMSALTASKGAINTNNPLIAIEAFQKIFIVNKTNLKVADFVNTKITTTDILPAGKTIPLKGDTLEATAGAASGAKMIVDYIDATDGACNIYGYRITTAIFEDTDVVTGTNDNGDVSFTLNAAETAPPHWYSWTVYSGDTTNYGTIPTSASLITLYRGRIVVNDDNRPHAWYMFRVDNPWKVKYDFDNDGDLSAVTHANSEVGEVGDIITALISYKDDLIIFGCVNSVWILVGDPMGSGQLARITGNTGIWGSRAWCMDDSNNLYFLGNDGLYRMLISESFSPPENISKLNLPNLMKDLDLDKSLHRVVLSFDPINFGILISKTTLADGSNTDYFFSLLTQGFYPEDYPNSCGIFSSYFYSATDETYKKFLVACNDGYIREFDNSTKSDIETDDSKTAIDSYFTIINKLSEDEDTEGRMNWLNAITAGGASGGDFSDSDSVDFSAFIGDDAETVLEDIIDGTATSDWATSQDYVVGDLRIYNHIEYISLTIHTSVAGGGVDGHGEPDTNTTDWSPVAFISGTWDGTGKQTKNRIRMRGYWFGLKLRNRTSDETFAMDKIYADIKPIKKER